MKPSIYIETTVVSFLTSRPSRLAISALRQKVTRQWWSDIKPRFDAFASPLVLDEASKGDPEAAKARLEVLASLPLLDTPVELDDLVRRYLSVIRLPDRLAQTLITSPLPLGTDWSFY